MLDNEKQNTINNLEQKLKTLEYDWNTKKVVEDILLRIKNSPTNRITIAENEVSRIQMGIYNGGLRMYIRQYDGTGTATIKNELQMPLKDLLQYIDDNPDIFYPKNIENKGMKF